MRVVGSTTSLCRVALVLFVVLLLALLLTLIKMGYWKSLRFRDFANAGLYEFENSGVPRVREFGSLGVWEFGSPLIIVRFFRGVNA